MGKNIISQRRGRGSPTYRIRKCNFLCRLEFKNGGGFVKDIVHDPGRTLPLMLIQYDNGASGYLPAKEGIAVKERVDDFVKPLSEIPESRPIFAIESYPNSGPVFCRAGGSFAMIVSKDSDSCVIKFPSKKTKVLSSGCRAVVGVPAGSGRKEKPWVGAGTKFIVMRRKGGKIYPRTNANCMNAVDHPFGGSYSGVNKPKSVSRDAPPGRKVGAIAPRRQGRKKK